MKKHPQRTNINSGSIHEYLEAMQASLRFGPQVVHVEEIRGNAAIYGQLEKPWSQSLNKVIASLSIEGLYAHQAEAINHIRSGRSIVTATQTASGKSLIYNLPIFEHLLANPSDHALYLFPLKALAQDQLRTIVEGAGANVLSRPFRPRAILCPLAHDPALRSSRVESKR